MLTMEFVENIVDMYLTKGTLPKAKASALTQNYLTRHDEFPRPLFLARFGSIVARRIFGTITVQLLQIEKIRQVMPLNNINYV